MKTIKKKTIKSKPSKTLFRDPRVRTDKVTMMKIRDIQKWTGEKTNGETVRNSVDSRWQHLKEEQESDRWDAQEISKEEFDKLIKKGLKQKKVQP